MLGDWYFNDEYTQNKIMNQWLENINMGNQQDIAKKRQVAGSHYLDMGIQPWDVVDTWPIEQQIGYYRGGALKYCMRLGNKDEALQEAKKLAHYAEKLVEVLERSRNVNKGE